MQSHHLATQNARATCAALLVATVLIGAPAAHAYPIGPECDGQYEVPGDLHMLQDNHLDVRVLVDANSNAIGYATYQPVNGNSLPTNGTARGSLNPDGRTFTYTVDWLNGFANTYYGTISNGGSIFGYTVNNKGTRNNWTTNLTAECRPGPTPTAPVSVPGIH